MSGQLKVSAALLRELSFRCPVGGKFFGPHVLVSLHELAKRETLFCLETNLGVQSTEINFTELRKSVYALAI